MKKSLMVLLVLLMVGSVMFAVVTGSPATVVGPGTQSTPTTMTVLASNASTTTFNLTQAAIGSSNKIDLAVGSNFRNGTSATVGSWTVDSTHSAGLKLEWYTDGGFTATVDSAVRTVPYKLSVAGEAAVPASDLTSSAKGTYVGFVRTVASGAFDSSNAANAKDIVISSVDSTTIYAASDAYTTTITFAITAN